MSAKIKLNAASGGGSFSLQAPSSSANNRVMTLPDTADGTILTTTNPRTGNVIQVAQSTQVGNVSSTSSTSGYPGSDIVASGHICSITPVATGSKFYVVAENISGHFNLNSESNSGAMYFLYVSVNSGTYANVTSSILKNVYAHGDIGNWLNVPLSFNFLASPSYSAGQTVAFQTYYQRTPNSSGEFYYHHGGQAAMNSQVRTLTVMEIAA